MRKPFLIPISGIVIVILGIFWLANRKAKIEPLVTPILPREEVKKVEPQPYTEPEVKDWGDDPKNQIIEAVTPKETWQDEYFRTEGTKPNPISPDEWLKQR